MVDRLKAWDIVTSAPVASTFFQWGTIPPSSTGEKKFFVKNESTQYIAKGVTIRIFNIGSTIPRPSDQLLFSIDEGIFTGTASLGDIPPSAISSQVTFRRVIASNAVSSDYYVIVEAASWSSA